MSEKIVVFGDGAMGTVCSIILAQKGYGVRLWGYSGRQIEQIERDRENKLFLPGFKLPRSIYSSVILYVLRWRCGISANSLLALNA